MKKGIVKKSDETSPRKPHVWEALLSFLFVVMVMAVGIAVFEVSPHIPMMIGAAFAALIALRLGFKWKDIEKSMFDGIYQALQAVVILCIIGVLIGVWMVSGVVPSMIYYGLKILSPQFFLVAALLICSITSLATGTSWGTAGTIGVALMGVATGLGINPAIAAGAIISGAYFGDKMSPLSDTTNLAPAMAGTDVFTHVKFMLRATLPVYIIVLVTYLVLGLKMGGAAVDTSGVEMIQVGISNSFHISPLLLLPPLIVIVSIAFKVPAIPGIVFGIVAGGVLGVFIQGNSFGDILSCAYGGYVSETGMAAIDKLLSTGGLTNMMYSISLTLIAMMFGGIMEKTKQLEVLVEKIIGRVKSTTGLVGTTLATCVVSNATMPEQYISIVVPGRMYASAYKSRGLHPKMLSNALEGAGTVSGALIPWNTCGVFMTTVLGVGTLQYLPFAFFNYLMPVCVFAMTAMGLLTVRREDDPCTIVENSMAIEEFDNSMQPEDLEITATKK